jgi:hypothetical protein
VSIDLLRAGLFPSLSHRARITSPEDDCYNCIAWAANDTDHWWWPLPGAYWPPDVPVDNTVDAFVAAFATLGYEPCVDGELEAGMEKVALYVDIAGLPTHMARQLPSGVWTSKLGDLHDIEHPAVEEVCGRHYGRVERYLRRPVPNAN